MKPAIATLSIFAVLMYFACSALPKRSPENFMEMGKRYYEKKNYEKAYKNYTRAIKLNPILSDAYLQRANVEIAIGDSLNREKAIDDLTVYIEATQERTALSKALNKRAQLMYNLGYKADACQDWTASCQLNIVDSPCEKYRLHCK